MTKIDENSDKKATKKPKKQKFAKNPFMTKALVSTRVGTRKISNSTGDKMLIVSQETGEIVAPAGFHHIVEVDKTQFVKLYINGVKAFQGLTSAGTQVFEVLYRAVQEQHNEDELYVSFNSVHQDITPMSESTFYRGLRELIAKGFIAQSTKTNIYFLNVDYMFNGNRLAFIKEYRLKAEPEAVTEKTIVDEEV